MQVVKAQPGSRIYDTTHVGIAFEILASIGRRLGLPAGRAFHPARRVVLGRPPVGDWLSGANVAVLTGEENIVIESAHRGKEELGK